MFWPQKDKKLTKFGNKFYIIAKYRNMKRKIFIVILCIAMIASFGCFSKENRVFATSGTTTLSIYGQSTQKVLPDKARVNASIQTLNLDVKKAKQEAFDRFEKIKTALLELGVENKDVQISYFSTYPHCEGADRSIIGYYANLSFDYSINNLENIQSSIDKLLENGVTNVCGINYEVSNYKAIYENMLTSAIKNAKDKAKIILNDQNLQIKSIFEEECYNMNCIYKCYYELAQNQNYAENNQIEITAKVKVEFN